MSTPPDAGTPARTGRVVVVGSVNVDRVHRLAALPAPGETVLARSMTLGPGGKGANQAAAARRAGAHVALVGRVGADGEGAAYRARLDDLGVDTTHLAADAAAPTGSATILVDDAGENSIVVVAGANGAVDAADVAGAGAVLAAADVVLTQLEVPLAAVEALLDAVAATSARLVVNASPVPDDAAGRDRLATLLSRLGPDDVVVVNEVEAARLGLAADDPRACTTLGAAGARWAGAVVPSPQVEPVDTTGAGDTFAGTLTAALARGADRAAALTAAVVAAARSTEWAGAQPG
ncbi:ribokinase [Nocardioides sp. ChNu-153]|uniref:PfkB family carbohydrate kinase n=1 Tax=Nocardioides sp. ChNu-153 TaxID=2779364 RepID=UPI00265036D5|nr:PfkB family carbohydrate kinase [Nocardioides sp. ChNu-153]MDN7121054.1 ribokinase [Nocardioides sp. ChNu-153]